MYSHPRIDPEHQAFLEDLPKYPRGNRLYGVTCPSVGSRWVFRAAPDVFVEAKVTGINIWEYGDGHVSIDIGCEYGDDVARIAKPSAFDEGSKMFEPIDEAEDAYNAKLNVFVASESQAARRLAARPMWTYASTEST